MALYWIGVPMNDGTDNWRTLDLLPGDVDGVVPHYVGTDRIVDRYRILFNDSSICGCPTLSWAKNFDPLVVMG